MMTEDEKIENMSKLYFELIKEKLEQNILTKQEKEIVRLQKYEKMVQFIANDYYELSYDKAKWQRDDWWKRCRKLIEEDHDH